METNNVCLVLNEEENNQLSFIMHEIHSSLNSITSLLRKMQTLDSINDLKEIALDASQNADTIRMFLEYWQISNNDSYFEGADMHPINIWRIFEKPNAYFMNLMRKKGLNYIVTKDEDVPFIEAFPIINAIVNILLDNAIKYSPNGTDIRCHFESNKTLNEIVISVENCGPYLEEKELEDIYTCGARGSNAQSIGVRGHGYGLNFLFRIIDEHGGDIEIQSYNESVINGVPYGPYICKISLPIRNS